MLGWGAERQERGGGKRGQQKQNGRVAGGGWGHQAVFQLYKAQRGCTEEGMGEWRKMLPGPHVQAKEVDVTLRPSSGG